VDQGTVANEPLHHTLWKLIRDFGGNRPYKTLHLLLKVAVYVFNGVNSPASVVNGLIVQLCSASGNPQLLRGTELV
jgi:hypothetical protein